jgi:hypothetical protein
MSGNTAQHEAEDNNVAQLPARQPLMAGAPVRAIVPSSMEDAFRIATAVVKAGMAPKDMNTPEKCLVAVMQGAEVGLTPMQSIQRIAVINGRPTIWGDAAIGLVRASGLCEYVKERIAGDGDKMVATCEAKRKGDPETIIGTFSVDDAKKAGLWGKAGPWQSYPRRMLQQRARGFALRDGFADVLGGMYLQEELEGADPEMVNITPPPAPPSAPKALTPPPAKPKAKPTRRTKKPEPEAETESESTSAELPGDWGDYLDRMKDELSGAKSEDDRKDAFDTASDTILGAEECGDLSSEDAQAVRRAWADIYDQIIGSLEPFVKAELG